MPQAHGLEQKLIAAGMLPLSENPTQQFPGNPAITDLDTFAAWVRSNYVRSTGARMQLELNKATDDPMFEWFFAYATVWGEVYENLKKATLDAPPSWSHVTSDQALDARLANAGLLTIASLLDKHPLGRFVTHTGVADLASFGAWLDMRRGEMASAFSDKDTAPPPGDEMFEWYFAHAAVLGKVHAVFAAVSSPPAQGTAADAPKP